jgi:hypothetical protein
MLLHVYGAGEELQCLALLSGALIVLDFHIGVGFFRKFTGLWHGQRFCTP